MSNNTRRIYQTHRLHGQLLSYRACMSPDAQFPWLRYSYRALTPIQAARDLHFQSKQQLLPLSTKPSSTIKLKPCIAQTLPSAFHPLQITELQVDPVQFAGLNIVAAYLKLHSTIVGNILDEQTPPPYVPPQPVNRPQETQARPINMRLVTFQAFSVRPTPSLPTSSTTVSFNLP